MHNSGIICIVGVWLNFCTLYDLVGKFAPTPPQPPVHLRVACFYEAVLGTFFRQRHQSNLVAVFLFFFFSFLRNN